MKILIVILSTLIGGAMWILFNWVAGVEFPTERGTRAILYLVQFMLFCLMGFLAGIGLYLFIDVGEKDGKKRFNS